MGEDVYEGRLQTEVKHEILKGYLLKMSMIVSHSWPSITYIDGFSGPWKSSDSEYKDTSFAIAIKVLRDVQQYVQKNTGRRLNIRCIFVEENPESFSLLEAYTGRFQNGSYFNIKTICSTFEDALEEVLEFVREDPETFPFALIDPIGWKGYKFNLLKSLIESSKKFEIIINFMTIRIQQFATGKEQAYSQGFVELYGHPDRVEQRSTLIREHSKKHRQKMDSAEASARLYCKRLHELKSGGLYVSRALVLKPDEHRPYFDLVHITQDIKGQIEFKKIVKKSIDDYDGKRSAERTKDANQLLIGSDDQASATNYEQRHMNLFEAKSVLDEILDRNDAVAYDENLRTLLELPFIWERDVRDWILDAGEQFVFSRATNSGITHELDDPLKKGDLVSRKSIHIARRDPL